MALAAIAAHKLWGWVPVGAIFKASVSVGQVWPRKQPLAKPGRIDLKVLQ
jgi:hypothetical protein